MDTHNLHRIMSNEDKPKVVTIDHANKRGDRDKLNPNSPLKRKADRRWRQVVETAAGDDRGEGKNED